jgi:hypothetical protein
MEALRRWRALPAERRPGTPQRLASLYERHVAQEGREERFMIFGSFLVTFGAVRFITHSIRARRFQRIFRNFSAGGGGLHLHHLVFGIVGLLVTGEIATGFHPRRRAACNAVSALFGASSALTVDEFALWLNLQDVYWAREGRESIDAAVVTAAAAFMAFDGRALFAAMGQDSVRLLRVFTARA